MPPEDRILGVVFEKTGEEQRVPLSALAEALTRFLGPFGAPPFVERGFAETVGGGDGASRAARLFAACGHGGDPEGFFAELLARLGRADGTGGIAVDGVALPPMLLVALLEVVLPGDRFVSVRSVDQLEGLTNVTVPEAERADLQKVIETYPVRLSMHTIRQMRVSRHVAYQYMPFVQELDGVGHTNTWIGQFHQGLLEQMYQNRVIFLLNMSCPVYCRFCFRKHKESRNETNPTAADVRRAIAHVEASPSIKEIVITGGDPFLNRGNLACAVDGLTEVEHVQTLRLATRSIAYHPHLFLSDGAELLGYLKEKSDRLRERGKRMEVATHFIHPDEVSPQSLQIITDLVANGIAVYVQTPFLRGCNDEGPELVRLFGLLRAAGAELHYIYIPCSPIHGNSVYWTPIAKGLEAGRHLRAHLSDRVIPRICTATPIGKMDWHTSGWAVEPVAGNDRFIWIRSPYTPDYFKRFAPLANRLDNIRVNAEGTIDIQYFADIGDDGLFLGPRPPRPDGEPAPAPSESTDAVAHLLRDADPLGPSIVPTGSPTLARVHETRVEIDPAFDEADLAAIRGDRRITDVVLVPRDGIVEALARVRALAAALREIPHVTALRLRSPEFVAAPERITPEAVEALTALNRLGVVHSLRLEIEVRFTVPGEFRPAHTGLARRLSARGVTVYNNTALLGGVNDAPDTIRRIAYECRSAGIEFHHLYLAGLPVQDRWNRDHPVSLYDVVDIASAVRREGSGREVPRYVVRTVLGEVDFGLSGAVTGEGETLSVVLLPYRRADFEALAPGFAWPDGVAEDAHGRPVVPVAGLRKTTGFALS